MHALTMFLPRWLASLSKAGSDITRHAVVVALGRRAYDFCHSQRRSFGHHCVRDHHWPGPEEPYQFAQDWWGLHRGLRPALAGPQRPGLTSVHHSSLFACPLLLLLLLLLASTPGGVQSSRGRAGMWQSL